MDRQQFAQWALALITFYPKADLLQNDKAISLWYEVLGDLDYEIATKALKRWVMTQKWPPTVADIRQLSESEKFRMQYEELLDNEPRKMIEG